MAKWGKESFIEDLREKCSRDIARIGVEIIEFAEKYADEVTWGRGTEKGTMTFRCNSDFGTIPIFHMSSDGQMNLLINFLRSKGLPKQVMRDMILKFESNFIREYDEEMYPVDSFIPIGEMFHTQSQVDKFLKTVEGCSYRLKQ